MRTLENFTLSDDLYVQLEKLARVRGTTPGDVAADFIKRALTGADEVEARLMADIRAEREALARRGFKSTAEEIQAAKLEGRK
jgi:hypothetical protein